MFVFSINPDTQLKEVVINPKMDEKALQDIVETSRKLIVELYLKCENDFLEGLEIFEAIVEKQILDTSKEQIKELETTIESTLETPSSETVAPETVAPETAIIEVETKEEVIPEVSSSLPEVVAETATLEEQILAPPDTSSDDEAARVEEARVEAEVKELTVQLNALGGGGSPNGVIVGGTKSI
jgi:hypothetical protein